MDGVASRNPPPSPRRNASVPRRRSWIRPVALGLCLTPLGKLGYDGFLGGGLGANPIAEILNRLGFWTLTMLAITLACTPAKILLGWTWPLRLRRMLGLITFGYALLHFTTYFALDQFFDMRAILADVVKRKFITLGFLAFLILAALAMTSTNAAVRRMGYVRWKRLHRFVYAAAALGLIHFYWRVKADHREPWIFIGGIGALLLVRVPGWLRGRGRTPPARRIPAP
jgi:methionine sulfoxide reductase heme-binding subunit